MAKPAVAVDPLDPEAAREAELESGRMPFLSHLTELRDRVRNAAIAFAIAFLLCWGFADRIFAWLREPSGLALVNWRARVIIAHARRPRRSPMSGAVRCGR